LLSLALVLGLEPKSLALAKHVLGLAGLVIYQTNKTVIMLKSTFVAHKSVNRPKVFIASTCATVELLFLSFLFSRTP